jgi:hypothetical protein
MVSACAAPSGQVPIPVTPTQETLATETALPSSTSTAPSPNQDPPTPTIEITSTPEPTEDVVILNENRRLTEEEWMAQLEQHDPEAAAKARELLASQEGRAYLSGYISEAGLPVLVFTEKRADESGNLLDLGLGYEYVDNQWKIRRVGDNATDMANIIVEENQFGIVWSGSPGRTEQVARAMLRLVAMDLDSSFNNQVSEDRYSATAMKYLGAPILEFDDPTPVTQLTEYLFKNFRSQAKQTGGVFAGRVGLLSGDSFVDVSQEIDYVLSFKETKQFQADTANNPDLIETSYFKAGADTHKRWNEHNNALDELLVFGDEILWYSTHLDERTGKLTVRVNIDAEVLEYWQDYELTEGDEPLLMGFSVMIPYLLGVYAATVGKLDLDQDMSQHKFTLDPYAVFIQMKSADYNRVNKIGNSNDLLKFGKSFRTDLLEIED